MMVMGIELISCPDCWAEPKLKERNPSLYTETFKRFVIICSYHDCQLGKYSIGGDTREEAARLWNKRGLI